METKTIRGLDPGLWRLARADAVAEGKSIGEWLNEAIKEKLKRKEVKK